MTHVPSFFPISVESEAFTFPAYHFLFEAFDRKLQQYIEADLIRYNIRAWKEKHILKTIEDFEKQFMNLKLRDFGVAFMVCLVLLALSVLVFSIEWLSTMKF